MKHKSLVHRARSGSGRGSMGKRMLVRRPCDAARANKFALATRIMRRVIAHGRFASFLLVAVSVGLMFFAGCVRRTITITTEPPNAMVFLNDQEIGRSTVTTDFLWYGDYDVVIRKDGYETLKTNWEIVPPWYQIVPLDFLAEVLWPGKLHDVRERHFVLQPKEVPTQEELLDRAVETRAKALDPRD